MGYAFINFWAVDAREPSEIFDSMVSSVETAFQAAAVPKYAESPMHPSRDWRVTVSTCALPQSWVSSSVEITHFTVHTIRVGTAVRGDIVHGVTHGQCHCYHKLLSRHLAGRLRIFLFTDLQHNISVAVSSSRKNFTPDVLYDSRWDLTLTRTSMWKVKVIIPCHGGVLLPGMSKSSHR